MAVGWMGIGGPGARAVSLRRPAGVLVVVGDWVAGDSVALGCPVAEVHRSAALGAERALRIVHPADGGSTRRAADDCARRLHVGAEDTTRLPMGEVRRRPRRAASRAGGCVSRFTRRR